MVSSACFAGLLFGALVFGWISDRFGRKTALLLTAIGSSVSSLAVSSAPNLETYAILRFFAVFFVHGAVPGN